MVVLFDRIWQWRVLKGSRSCLAVADDVFDEALERGALRRVGAVLRNDEEGQRRDRVSVRRGGRGIDDGNARVFRQLIGESSDRGSGTGGAGRNVLMRLVAD